MNEPLLIPCDDGGDIELQIDNIEDNSVDWFESLYTFIQEKTKRTVLSKADFMYEMIPTKNGEYYWISNEHPIAKAMADNDFQVVQMFKGECGTVTVYRYSSIKSAIDEIVEMCLKHGLKINDAI